MFFLVLAISAVMLLKSSRQDRSLETLDLRLPFTYSNGCHLDSLAYYPLQCPFGSPEEKRKVYLFGDSHAAQWIPALERAASIGHFQGRILTKSSCPFFYLDLDEACNKWQSAALQQIVNEKPNLLIIASLTNESYKKSLDENQYVDAVIRGLVTIKQKLPKETRLMLINDSPYLTTDPIPCLQQHAAKKCDFKSTLSLTTTKMKNFSRLNGIYFKDLTTEICKMSICKTGNENINFFRDNHHISHSFSEDTGLSLAESIRRLLEN